MLAAAGDGYAIQYLEEIKTEHPEEALCGSLFIRQFGPVVIRLLGLAEDVIQ